ncbi:MAG: hypothetical protein HZA93_04590 [Verrucomicrobia bacterium]|nr:hypothetical protein [Verrucomicrobiota bacterium]
MKSPQPYAIALLALTTLGGAFLAWQQYQELVELRAAALNKDERADLQKRLWDAEKLNRELQDRLAAARRGTPGEALVSAERPEDEARGRGGPGPRGGRGGPPNPMQQMEAVRQLLAKPEVQALMNVQQKAGIEARYAALFKSLNLSPEQRAKFESAIMDFQATQMDVLTAAREQGVRDPETIRKLMGDARNEFSSTLQSLLGESGFAQFQTYEQTLPQRNLVNQLQQRLSYTDTPLTPIQAEQLVQILASNPGPRPAAAAQPADPAAPPRGPGPGGPGGRGPDLGAIVGGVLGGDLGGMIGAMTGGGPGPAGPGGRGGPAAPAGAVISAAAVNQSQSVLSQPQVSALQQLQQQQQAQQQLAQIVRETVAPNPGNRSAEGGPPPGQPGQRKRGN